MSNEFLIRKAVELAKFGQKEGAQAILQAMYPGEANNVQYWAASALAAESNAGAIESLEEILRIEPDNTWASVQIQRLRSLRSEKQKVRSAKRFWDRVIKLHIASYGGLAAAAIATVMIMMFGIGETPAVAGNEVPVEAVVATPTELPAPPTLNSGEFIVEDARASDFGVQAEEEAPADTDATAAP